MAIKVTTLKYFKKYGMRWHVFEPPPLYFFFQLQKNCNGNNNCNCITATLFSYESFFFLGFLQCFSSWKRATVLLLWACCNQAPTTATQVGRQKVSLHSFFPYRGNPRKYTFLLKKYINFLKLMCSVLY